MEEAEAGRGRRSWRLAAITIGVVRGNVRRGGSEPCEGKEESKGREQQEPRPCGGALPARSQKQILVLEEDPGAAAV